MASGVKIPDTCVHKYKTELKMDKKHRYIIYKLTKDFTEIEVEACGLRDETYDMFRERLLEAEREQECRYAILDLDYFSEKHAANATKIIFVSWAPDTARVKNKMVHASTKDAFKKALGEGISKEFQASDTSDLEMQDFVKELDKLSK